MKLLIPEKDYSVNYSGTTDYLFERWGFFVYCPYLIKQISSLNIKVKYKNSNDKKIYNIISVSIKFQVNEVIEKKNDKSDFLKLILLACQK